MGNNTELARNQNNYDVNQVVAHLLPQKDRIVGMYSGHQ